MTPSFLLGSAILNHFVMHYDLSDAKGKPTIPKPRNDYFKSVAFSYSDNPSN